MPSPLAPAVSVKCQRANNGRPLAARTLDSTHDAPWDPRTRSNPPLGPSPCHADGTMAPGTESPPAGKEAAIRAACRHGGRASALVELATSPAGLVSDDLRRIAWPLLLGCARAELPAEKETLAADSTKLSRHKDEDQVALDVHRAFVYYPPADSEPQLAERKQHLARVILTVLRRHPALCYFQGYHDIVQVFLLVLGPHDAPAAVARLSLLRIRDFMLSSIAPAMAQLELLRPLLRAADPRLYAHLPRYQPSFALADTITMFAHNIQDYRQITRLFDFFLACHAAMPIYLFAAVVLSKRNELLALDQDDQDMLFFKLGKMPDPFDVEFHIARALELFERLPPASLRSWEWWRISSFSVLKASATSLSLRCMTLEQGEALFARHEKQLQRRMVLDSVATKLTLVSMRLWYYRRYGAVGLAIVVGAYAVWLGRYGGIGARYPFLDSLAGLVSRFLGGP